MEETSKEILKMVREKGGDIRNLWGSICENQLIKHQRILEKEGYLNNGVLTKEGEQWLKS